MPLQHGFHLISDVVPQEGNAEVHGHGLADGHGDVPWPAGPGHAEHLGVHDRGGAQSCNLVNLGIDGCHFNVGQPDPALLKRLSVQLMPLATRAGSWLFIHGPADAVDPVLPVLKLVASRMVGVAEMLEQGHGLEVGCLLRTPFTQFRLLLPKIVENVGRHLQQFTAFTRP